MTFDPITGITNRRKKYHRDVGQILTGFGSNEATANGALLGWAVLALPTVWLFYEAGWWAGLCVQSEGLTAALLTNAVAVILLGVWINQLRTARDERQDQL